MNGKLLRIIAGATLLLSLLVWIYGGAQRGFYKTYYTVDRVDPVTEIEYQERVDAFLPGIETLVIGFALFAGFIIAGAVVESRSRQSKQRYTSTN